MGGWSVDLATGARWRDERLLRLCGLPPGTPADCGEAFDALILPEDRFARDGALRRALAGDGEYRAEFCIRRADTGEVRWLAARGRVLRGADGRPERLIGVNFDVTERKAAEQRQALLTHEVAHRAKNALAVVQATLRLTRADDIQEFVRAVEGRVAALGRAHTMLAEGRWEGAALRPLIEAELAVFLPPAGAAAAATGTAAEPSTEPATAPRVAVDGPTLTLSPAAAQALSMALHELATNAAKYGALSVPGGRIAVSWRVDRSAGLLRLRWRERGGPAVVAPPSRKGFGSRVIETTVRDQLGGRLEKRWEEAGMVCAIEVPLGRVLAARANATGPALPDDVHRAIRQEVGREIGDAGRPVEAEVEFGIASGARE